MDRLKQILRNTMLGYAGEALNGYSYLTSGINEEIFTVVSVGQVSRKHVVDTGLVARVQNDQIIIEHDVNDKPLIDALLAAGIPRNQIVLAYLGEENVNEVA